MILESRVGMHFFNCDAAMEPESKASFYSRAKTLDINQLILRPPRSSVAYYDFSCTQSAILWTDFLIPPF